MLKKEPKRTLIEGKLGATIAKNVMRITQPVRNEKTKQKYNHRLQVK